MVCSLDVSCSLEGGVRNDWCVHWLRQCEKRMVCSLDVSCSLEGGVRNEWCAHWRYHVHWRVV